MRLFIGFVLLVQLGIVFFFSTQREENPILQLASGDPHAIKRHHLFLYHKANVHSDRSLDAIFFNIFVNEDSSIGIDIAMEQFKQIRDSAFSTTPIYYTTIGKLPDVPLCSSSHCYNSAHLEKGDELATLSLLSEYCRANPTNTVTYIHNKGSFTPRKENMYLRRMHMKAIFDPEGCTTRPKACNVCSARFSPLPHFHTSGNMFVVGCDYVEMLIPPEDFGRKMLHTVADGFLTPESIFLPSSIDLERLSAHPHIGTGRYAYEHWIHSHPSVVPCDVYPGPFTWNYDNIPNTSDWVPDLRMAPRFPLQEFWKTSIILEPEPWYLIKGRNFEWKHLYDAEPPLGSWIRGYYKHTDMDSPICDTLFLGKTRSYCFRS